MLSSITLFALTACFKSESPNNTKKLTIQRLFESPNLNGKSPRRAKFSNSGKMVGFLQAKKENRLVMDLWTMDTQTGEKNLLVDSKGILDKKEILSEEEKARRERMRIQSKGIINYFWAPDDNSILFPLGGDLFLYNLKTKNSTRLTTTKEYETDIRFSPKGTYASFIRSKNLYYIHLKTRKEIKVTTGGGENNIKYGMAEFIAQEEMKRQTGYWWSNDEKYLAYTKVDETPVKLVTRYDITADKVKPVEQRYPETGTANVTIEMAVAQIKDHRPSNTKWINLGKNKDIYLPRVKWTQKTGLLSYQVMERHQQILKLYFYNYKSNASENILTETQKSWINLNSTPLFLKDKDEFIWVSERTGFKHLFLYNYNGDLIQQLTSGPWQVRKLLSLNEADKIVYFTATKKSPTENHLYSTQFDKNKDLKQISNVEGWNSPRFSKDSKFYINYFSNPTTPWQVSVHKSSGERTGYVEENKLDKNHPLRPYLSSFSEWEFGNFKASDGHILHYKILKPQNFSKSKKYPLLLSVYGGPGVQLVTKMWQRNLHQIMTQAGFIVLSVDNRGTPGRGVDFERAIYKRLGHLEAKDQLAGINHITQKGFIDKSKINVFGWSYGGYMTLMLMSKYPEVFNAGVSGAPVSDFSLYDTYYTEKYLSTPQQNPKGYEQTSVLPLLKNLKGRLMIVHGMADDNVLFTNTTKAFSELQKHGKIYESIVYPGAKHGIYGKHNKVHFNTSLMDFLNRYN